MREPGSRADDSDQKMEELLNRADAAIKKFSGAKTQLSTSERLAVDEILIELSGLPEHLSEGSPMALRVTETIKKIGEIVKTPLQSQAKAHVKSSTRFGTPLPQVPEKSKVTPQHYVPQAMSKEQIIKQENLAKTMQTAQRFQSFTAIMAAANELGKGQISTNGMRNLTTRFREFQTTSDYQNLESIEKESIQREFTTKMRDLGNKKLLQRYTPVNKAVESESAALLERADKMAHAGSSPKEITQLMNDYLQYTQSSAFTNSSDAAKNQFEKKFENAIKELSKPYEAKAESTTATEETQAAPTKQKLLRIGTRRQKSETTPLGERASNTANDAPSSAEKKADAASQTTHSKKPLLSKPFRDAMAAKNARVSSDVEVTTTKQTSRRGSVKGP